MLRGDLWEVRSLYFKNMKLDANAKNAPKIPTGKMGR
jgi:hypothetical protein